MTTPSKPETSPPAGKPSPVTLERATYQNTKAILQAVQPLAGLAERAQGTETEHGLTEMLLDTLHALLEGQKHLREGLEALHARLDNPSLEAAMRAAVKG